MKAASAASFSGNSRKMKRILLVSMYSVLSLGQVSAWKAAQCGQVAEAYSTTVTLASSPAPSDISPSSGGFMNSAMSSASAGSERTGMAAAAVPARRNVRREISVMSDTY